MLDAIKNFKHFGTIALLFSIPAFIPQVIKVFETNDTHSFSARTLLLFWASQIFWLIHSIFVDNKQLSVRSIVNFICFTYIIYVCIQNNHFNILEH